MEYLSQASHKETRKTMKYQTFEEDAPGTVIGNLAKDIAAATGGSRTNFRMMKQFNSSFVRLRESDGQLSIGERVDRERVCKHTLHCLIAFDVVSFSKEQFKLIHVEVEVKDINDNSPEFPRKESSLEISENTAVGKRIPLDFAVDEDVGLNYIQSYQISVNSHFSIDVLSRADGVKYAELVLMKELDRETQATYALELVAMDGGNPSRTGTTRINVKVKDYNDNSPVFDRSSFSVDLPEDAPVGTLLLDLNAEDPDEGLNGEVVYGFGNQVPAEIRQLFRVDRKTGRLTLETPVDFESKNTYEFDVQASDLGPNPSPAICKIVVQVQDVNDNAPEISITPMTSITAGIAYITEAAARESFVALVSTSDRDSGANGQVHCTLYGHDHFRLQQAYEDSFMIVSTGPLDREKIPEYNLTVVAEDLGSPPFRTITQYTIRLTDENDNAPVFSKAAYEVAVVENNAPGAYITTVVARDTDTGSNGKVSYKLADTYFMGSPISTFVSVDPASGSLYALRSFNYEVLLPRDAPGGYVVTRVQARDADEGVNSELSYGLATGEPSVFSVNKATGEIYLNQVLSHDVDETLSVTVTVSDATCARPRRTAARCPACTTQTAPASSEGTSTRLEAPLGHKQRAMCNVFIQHTLTSAVRPITIWKGNSYATISARDPAFSGKDSGKGDSDFNDSDSDVSGDTGLKKDGAVVPPMGGQNALWACTSECKVLGHSDRCWSPSAARANAAPSPAPTLSSFGGLSKTASLPRDPNRRDNYYQAHIPKTVGLQSVYEKVLHREYDYVLVAPPRPVRVQEISDITLPVYTPTPTHCPNADA
uniref:Cadherin domain-containing protein n=1 Tax=Mola mola TaxID=94237 RepID=A0A3Q3XI58_MOLML